jgi:hypothetical protein
MTDHIEHAKLLTEKVLPFVGYGKPEFAALKAAIIMLERAALSAREGGEVVGVGVDAADGLAHVVVRLGNQVIYSQAHPAQPASHPSYQSATDSSGIGSSQQGEKWLREKATEMRMADADKASVEELCQYLNTYVRPHFALNEAHPTGDRVRGLVEKWREESGRMAEDTAALLRDDACFADGKSSGIADCADELAAALDQEKGR